MSEKLYYRDAFQCDFEATVLECIKVDRGYAIRLDQTAFYPTSGGQPNDTGVINGVAVMDVYEQDENVWHLLKKDFSEQDKVHGTVDWERRFDHMQQHSGQHLLSAAFVEMMEAETVGFHLGSQVSTIDLNLAELSWEAAFQVENAVNQIVWEDRSIEILFVDFDRAASLPLRKPPKVDGVIRVIRIDDYDASACGGTHVNRTGEIGMIKIAGIERYKGGVRITFLCGNRALQDYQRVLIGMQAVSSELSVHQDDLLGAVRSLQAQVKDAQRKLKHVSEALAVQEAEKVWMDGLIDGETHKVLAVWQDRDFSEVRMLASKLIEHSVTIVLLATYNPDGLRMLCSRSDDLLDWDCSDVLRVALSPLQGQGGGSPSNAQGGAAVSDPEKITDSMRTALKIL